MRQAWKFGLALALVALGVLTDPATASALSTSHVHEIRGVIRATNSDIAPSRVVLLGLTGTTLTTGQTARFAVTVVPRIQDRIVVLERRGTKRWRNLESKFTNQLGKATFDITAVNAGVFRYRAVVIANTQYVAATSRPASLAVTLPPPVYAGASLGPGAQGARVLALQQRLSSLGYWLGTPNGIFGDATEQAVYAVQKAANLSPTGVVNPATVQALVNGTLPTPRSASGYLIEVNLHDDLVMIMNNGQIKYVLNTSTGGGYTYVEKGISYVATTPTGVFHIYRTVNGLVIDPLGQLWRPRFFDEGFAIHGDTYVPPDPESHGCVRVSYQAINWIWANNIAPIGTEVWVY